MLNNKEKSKASNPNLSEPVSFNIYLKTSSNEVQQDELEVVKNGFSWPALFFGPIWAFYKNMPGIGFGLVFLLAPLNVIGKIIDVSDALSEIEGLTISLVLMVLFFAILIWVGTSGNNWLKSSLEKKGYKLVQADVIVASPSEAIQMYKKTHDEEIKDDGDNFCSEEKCIRLLSSKDYKIEEKTDTWVDTERIWEITDLLGKKVKISSLKELRNYTEKIENQSN